MGSLILPIVLSLGPPQEFPDPAWVVDQADILDAETEERLTDHFLELRDKTGAEVAVVVVRTTGGFDIFDYSFRLAQSWGVGKAKGDTGVVLVAAIDDRKGFIQVGYGLEGAIPDSLASRIGREHIAPHFKDGHYSQGVLQGSLAILNIVAEEYGVTLEGLPPVKTSRGWTKTDRIGGGICLVGFILFMVFLGFLFRSTGMGRYQGSGWLWYFLLGSTFRGHHGGYWGGRSGGFFGGGGFGGSGFGGFGGGSFGGGGGGFSW